MFEEGAAEERLAIGMTRVDNERKREKGGKKVFVALFLLFQFNVKIMLQMDSSHNVYTCVCP